MHPLEAAGLVDYRVHGLAPNRVRAEENLRVGHLVRDGALWLHPNNVDALVDVPNRVHEVVFERRRYDDHDAGLRHQRLDSSSAAATAPRSIPSKTSQYTSTPSATIVRRCCRASSDLAYRSTMIGPTSACSSSTSDPCVDQKAMSSSEKG